MQGSAGLGGHLSGGIGLGAGSINVSADFQGALGAGLQAVLLDRGKNSAGVTDDAPRTERPSEIGALDELEAWLS